MASVVNVVPRSVPRPYYSKSLRDQYIQGDVKLTPLLFSPNPLKVPFEPNFTEYHIRTTHRLLQGGLERDLPRGWPISVSSPLVWDGTDFADSEEHVYHLSAEEKTELGQALEHFKELELDGSQVTRDNFPLPSLKAFLAKACNEIFSAQGFIIIRGLDVNVYSPEDLTLIFLGISSYIGEKRGKQDQRGSMLMHVLNKISQSDPHELCFPKDSNSSQPFHADTVCDVIAMLTRSCAEEGGKSIISSSWTVYNELAATRPDLIHVLAKPDWPFDTFGRDPPYYRRALLYNEDGKIILNFSRRLLTGSPASPRTAGLPPLNEAQAEALDAVHFIAQKYQLATTMQQGDIRFINNLSILHCREAFTDGQDSKRHLVRLWLRNEEKAWKLPPALRVAWARVFEDHEREEVWDIEPPSHKGIPLRQMPSCD